MNEIIVVAVVLVLGLGAYWSMVIFPRQREFQKQQKYVRGLSIGDEMITYGGLIGKVIEIDTEIGIAYVEIAEGVVVKMVAGALLRPYVPEELAEAAQKANSAVNSAQ
jgi:preprotein translocase subunit YajC